MTGSEMSNPVRPSERNPNAEASVDPGPHLVHLFRGPAFGSTSPAQKSRKEVTGAPHSARKRKKPHISMWVLLIAASSIVPRLQAQENSSVIDDITAKYHFISNDDTLAILDEEGKLKGYVEVAQPAGESTDVLTFNITEGSRDRNEVRFRTERIHGKFYRFSGTAARGKGRDEKDSDYFELKGTLETVTVNSDTNQEAVQSTQVTLKSIGKNERPDDN